MFIYWSAGLLPLKMVSLKTESDGVRVMGTDVCAFISFLRKNNGNWDLEKKGVLSFSTAFTIIQSKQTNKQTNKQKVN